MNQKRYKYFENKAQELGKQLFVEESLISVPVENVEIFESSKLVESADGNKYQARGILKKVPVARYDEFNQNNRKYPLQIGVNIQKNRVAEGNDCFGDHADEEPSVFDTVGVWHNFVVEGNIGYADVYCIGEGGQLMLEKAKAGGKCGYSTVGYGELMEDGSTVNPETFSLDHLADWVNNPSARVFGTNENISESTQQTEENTNIKNIMKDNNTNKKETEIIKEENILSENKKREINIMNDKVQLANLKNHVRIALKEAKKNENYREAIEDLVAVKQGIPEELSEQIAELDQAIISIQEKMEIQIKEAKEAIQEKEESVKDLTEKIAVADKAMNDLKEENEKLKGIIEKIGDEKEVSVLEENFNEIKKDLESMCEDRENMEDDIKHLLTDRKEMLEDINRFKEERKAFIEGKKTMKNDIKKYEEKLKKAEAHITSLEKILEDEFGYEFDDVEDPYIDPMNDEGMPQMGTPTEIDEEDYMEMYGSGMYEEEEEDEEDEELEEAEDMEDEDEDDEEEMKESKQRQLQSQIKSWYTEAVKKQPALKDLKSKIFKSKSLYEATQWGVKLTAKKSNDMMSLNESKTKLPDLELYKPNKR